MVSEAYTASDIDRLAAMARRQPAVEAAMMWTMVWVFVVFVFASAFSDFFFIDGAIQLSRVTLAIVVGAVIAAAICAVYARWAASKVEEARATLRHLIGSIG